jgi:hypothetical protein
MLRDLDNNVPRAHGFFCGQRQSGQNWIFYFILKLMMVISADRRIVYMRNENVSNEPALVLTNNVKVIVRPP